MVRKNKLSKLIGERIYALRTESKVSAEKVANKIGVAHATIRKSELGVNIPTIAVLLKLASYFKTSVSYLAGETNIKDKPKK